MKAVVRESWGALRRLLGGHGPLRPGRGRSTGVLALALAALSLLAVLAFHFPQYLTTPALRALYDVTLLRQLLYGALVLAGGLSLLNLLLGRTRWLAAWALALVLLAVALGGHRVPVADFADGTPYLGLDWFILDLLASALLFVLLEKLWPLRREQPVFRAQWQTDLQHFALNHLLVGLLLLATNWLVQRLFGWAADDDLQAAVQGLNFWVALGLLLLLADLVQYAVHRAFHEVPALWRLHAVHHSVETMDWLAGSRLHLLEVLVVRSLVLAPIWALGFAKEVVDAYIVIVGLHAVFNHCNVDVRLGPLRHVIVTPHFHHWHHAQDAEALDRNYAAHFAFIDHLFGTAVRAGHRWPQRYGVLGERLPEGLWAQTAYPFRRRRERG